MHYSVGLTSRTPLIPRSARLFILWNMSAVKFVPVPAMSLNATLGHKVSIDSGALSGVPRGPARTVRFNSPVS